MNQLPTVSQFTSEMEDDIKRYPLPLCMDAHEEQGQLYRRYLRLKEIAERFIRFKTYQQNKQS